MEDECAKRINEICAVGRTFTVDEAESTVEFIYDCCRIDLHDRFHNLFFYEVSPLVSIARYVSADISGLEFTGERSRFDGLIRFNNEKESQKIELTAAIDGRNDALQMELLERQGHAPAFRKIQATGNKRNREFPAEANQSVARRAIDYDRFTLLPLLQSALEKKIQKARANHDYCDAWLGIVFDDYCCPDVEAKPMRFDPLGRHILRNGSRAHAPFSRVFLVGVSRKYLFDSKSLLG